MSLRMETRMESPTMTRLLRHGAANWRQLLRRALDWGCTRPKTGESGGDMRLVVLRSGGNNVSGRPAGRIVRKRIEDDVLAYVSEDNPASFSVTASGSIRRPAASLLFCFGSAAYWLRFPSSTDPP
jgi:hypothetical protein